MQDAGASVSLSPLADKLSRLPISLSDSQPTLAGPKPRVTYEVSSERNAVGYADRNGFEGYSLQFADETKGLVELEALAERGNELASAVYTYRSVARALPPASGDEANKRKMYSASFEVLEPHVNRIKPLLHFKVGSATSTTVGGWGGVARLGGLSPCALLLSPPAPYSLSPQTLP